MDFNQRDRILGMSLSSRQLETVMNWLSVEVGEDSTLPPIDQEGRVDPYALAFREGQRAILRKMRVMERQLRERMNGDS